MIISLAAAHMSSEVLVLPFRGLHQLTGYRPFLDS